jgi:meiotic recombination protein REC8
MDDPAFELNFQLPDFNLDDDVLFAQLSQNNTQKTSSQMSPYTGDDSSGHRSAFGGLDISASPGASFHQLEMPFGRDSLASQKPGEGALGNLGAEEDQFVLDDDWGIRIDENGNIIQDDEPELPGLEHLNLDPAVPAVQQDAPALVVPEQDEMIIDMGEDVLPEAEAFPQRRSDNMELQESSSAAVAPARQRARRRAVIRPDRETVISRTEFNSWTANYLARSEEARKAIRPVTQAQAKRNAYDLTFGFGIAHVGRPTVVPGVAHPLAELFAGAALQRAVLGFVIDGQGGNPRGHRRTSGEAFGPEAEDSNRRVRPRLDDSQQVARGAAEDQQDAQIQQDDDNQIFFDPDLEIGREAAAPGSARSELASSVPWNRPGSASAHGSSIKAAGGGTGRQVSASPLHGRGSGLPAIERFSDDLPFGSDGLLGGQHSSSIHGEQAGASQVMQQALDQEGRNFLGFIEGIAATKGGARDDDARRWVDFDDLFEPQDVNKVVVTQAFFHVLALATRNMIKVEQDDQLEVPFGPIRLGILAVEER